MTGGCPRSDKANIGAKGCFDSIVVFAFLVQVPFTTYSLQAQHSEIESRLNNGELEMTFPSIYFINNSTEFAIMPYTVDSCIRYIALHKTHITSFALWRDSTEPELLSRKRALKLKAEINKHVPAKGIRILSMGNAQKLSRRTIQLAGNERQTQLLLSLNSVLDVSTSRRKIDGKVKSICWYCLIRLRPCQVNRYLLSKIRNWFN